MTQTSLATKSVPVAKAHAHVEAIRREPGTIQVTIDGAKVTVPAGISILNAARQYGIDIPVLCHQPNERPIGVCRMCSVEAGEKTLSAACVKPVDDGMVVKTNSQKVRRARRILLELLLAEHPSPCVRQERSGDCELEMLAQKEGILAPRFSARAISRGADGSSAAIAVDHEACILCDRCIRACNEVRQNNVIGRKGKGYLAGIAFDLDDPMGSSSCISCGECMVSCPTGALTNKTVVPAALPDGQPADCRFLKQLPYFEGISSTFLELNRQAVVVRRFQAGQTIIREGEYGSTAFLILEGQAQLFLQRTATRSREKPKPDTLLTKLAAGLAGKPRDSARPLTRASIPRAAEAVELGPGDLFGETTCLNHYPRTETVRTVTECVTLEILRNVLEMMLQRNEELRHVLDSNYRKRLLRAQLRNTLLFSSLSDQFLESLKDVVELMRVQKGEPVFRQRDHADCFYVIRSGFVKIAEQRIEGEVVLAYLGPRQHFGLDGQQFRQAAATALDHVDLIRIGDLAFDETIASFAEDRDRFEVKAEDWQRNKGKRPTAIHGAPLQQFLNQGLMEANSVLILNLEKCTRCDACVRACADAHDGVTRLVREGQRFDNYLVATSCRQCRDPLCMVGCPVGSIRRRNSLEIVIEDWCIGCGQCASNCPYGNIHMHPVSMPEGDLQARPAVQQKATACDLCSGLAEPSCVYACPHDAAQRVDAPAFFGLLPGSTMWGGN